MNIQRIWILFILLFVFLATGCTGTGGIGNLDLAEEKEIKENLPLKNSPWLIKSKVQTKKPTDAEGLRGKQGIERQTRD